MNTASSIHPSWRLRHNTNVLYAATAHSRSGDRLNWKMLAIWVFVVFCFAALVFATYVIWAKCASPSPVYYRPAR